MSYTFVFYLANWYLGFEDITSHHRDPTSRVKIPGNMGISTTRLKSTQSLRLLLLLLPPVMLERTSSRNRGLQRSLFDWIELIANR